MSKVTSKYRVSIPKAIAERVGIRVGDELEWEDTAGTLRVRPAAAPKAGFRVIERLRLFDAATARQKKRANARGLLRSNSRAWSREDLYRR